MSNSLFALMLAISSFFKAFIKYNSPGIDNLIDVHKKIWKIYIFGRIEIVKFEFLNIRSFVYFFESPEVSPG